MSSTPSYAKPTVASKNGIHQCPSRGLPPHRHPKLGFGSSSSTGRSPCNHQAPINHAPKPASPSQLPRPMSGRTTALCQGWGKKTKPSSSASTTLKVSAPTLPNSQSAPPSPPPPPTSTETGVRDDSMDTGAPTAAGAISKLPTIDEAPAGKAECPWYPGGLKGGLSTIAQLPKSDMTDYTIEEAIGRGTYGSVSRATVRNGKASEMGLPAYGTMVALKKVNLQPGGVTGSKVHYLVLNELAVLKAMAGSPHVVQLYSFMHPEGETSELILVMNYAKYDLYSFMKVYNLTKQQKKTLLYQLIYGIAALHEAGFIHRDIKPANVLVDSDLKLKIGDLGQACRLRQADIMTGEYPEQMDLRVQSAHYRAPEILGAAKRYGIKIDSWSIGILAVRMMGGLEPFIGQIDGEGFDAECRAQSKKINAVCCTHTVRDVHVPGGWRESYLKRSVGYSGEVNVLPALLRRRGVSGAACRQLVQDLLQMNPATRLSAQDALNQAYFTGNEDGPLERLLDPNSTKLERNPEFAYMTLDNGLHEASFKRQLAEELIRQQQQQQQQPQQQQRGDHVNCGQASRDRSASRDTKRHCTDRREAGRPHEDNRRGMNQEYERHGQGGRSYDSRNYRQYDDRRSYAANNSRDSHASSGPARGQKRDAPSTVEALHDRSMTGGVQRTARMSNASSGPWSQASSSRNKPLPAIGSKRKAPVDERRR